jgi:hypothetical protein
VLGNSLKQPNLAYVRLCYPIICSASSFPIYGRETQNGFIFNPRKDRRDTGGLHHTLWGRSVHRAPPVLSRLENCARSLRAHLIEEGPDLPSIFVSVSDNRHSGPQNTGLGCVLERALAGSSLPREWQHEGSRDGSSYCQTIEPLSQCRLEDGCRPNSRLVCPDSAGLNRIAGQHGR